METLVELGLTDDWQHMIDSTAVRGHSQAAGAKRGTYEEALVEAAAAFQARSTPPPAPHHASVTRSLASFARADGQGRPLGFVLTGGEASDHKAVDVLVALPVRKPRMMRADNVYDGDSVRSALLVRGVLPVAGRKSTARRPSPATSEAKRTAIGTSACSAHPNSS